MRLRIPGYRVNRAGAYYPERLQRRRQFHVAVRSKVRRLQWAERIAILLIVSLGIASLAVMRHFPSNQFKVPDFSVVLMPKALRLERASIKGAPPVFEERLMHDLGPDHPWGFLEPYRASKQLLRDFPCLESVRFERDWRGRELRFQVELRRPLARAIRDEQPWGWLSDTGILYTAPAGIYPDADWVQVELGRGGDSNAAALSQFLQQALKNDVLPARLVRVEFRSPEEGWELILADKTKVLWGDLNWTNQKSSRLKEVLADGQAHGRAGWVADLRYFEEGKILMRPKL